MKNHLKEPSGVRRILKRSHYLGITLSIILFPGLFISCGGGDSAESGQSAEVILPDEGMEITEAWARPGRESGVSAIYFIAANGSVETDTLLSLSSPVAGMVELHETYEQEGDMMGMRRAETPIFPGRSTTVLQPGGLHIMLMQLKQPLNEGDEIELILEFALAGEVTVTVPVRGM